MSSVANNRVQFPLNMVLPLKAPLEQLKQGMAQQNEREQVEANDAIGTLHFSRLVDLSEPAQPQVGFLTVYNGDFRTYIGDFAKHLGLFFDRLFTFVDNGPPLPCAKNKEAFTDWIAAHNPEGIGFYSAYPNLTVQDIRARFRVAAGAYSKQIQSPLCLRLRAKSPGHQKTLSELIARSASRFHAAADTIGTVHFARFLPHGTDLILIGEHDGDVQKLAVDFSAHLGPLFDEMFENVVDPPRTPVQKNAPAFTDWFSAQNMRTLRFYSAYPTLSVRDIRAGATNK